MMKEFRLFPLISSKVGTMDIPNLKQIPDNNVKIHTRQGMDIEYSA